MSVTRKHLAETQPVLHVIPRMEGHNYQGNRPRLECADGFSVSVQASDTHYSTPRKNGLRDCYSSVELGFPSERDEIIMPYAEDADNPTGTVYGYVPVAVVDALIEKHGGLKL